MGNLGGHDLPSLLAAFEAARTHDRPVCFIAYTIKGHGLPLAGHKDNHAGLMTPAQVDTLRDGHGRPRGPRMGAVRGARRRPSALQAFLAAVPFFQKWPRRTQRRPHRRSRDARRRRSSPRCRRRPASAC